MAANTRDIRRRIKSIRSTAQITKAMQMVAAAKMRKAQQAALAGRPFAEMLNRVIVSVRDREEELVHPLFEERPVRRELVIAITSDRGLCGAFNTNLARELATFDSGEVSFVAIGRKGFQYLSRTRREIVAHFEMKDTPSFAEVRPVARLVLDQYLEGKVDRVRVLYNAFVNTLTQTPVIQPLAPISPLRFGKDAKSGAETESHRPAAEDQNGYLFEPAAADLLEQVLPQYVTLELLQMILDSQAAEQSARMVAMKNATENAKEIVKDLTLEYNKLRQAGITSELLEISTAQMALS